MCMALEGASIIATNLDLHSKLSLIVPQMRTGLQNGLNKPKHIYFPSVLMNSWPSSHSDHPPYALCCWIIKEEKGRVGSGWNSDVPFWGYKTFWGWVLILKPGQEWMWQCWHHQAHSATLPPVLSSPVPLCAWLAEVTETHNVYTSILPRIKKCIQHVFKVMCEYLNVA